MNGWVDACMDRWVGGWVCGPSETIMTMVLLLLMYSFFLKKRKNKPKKLLNSGKCFFGKGEVHF